jgi:hypothetical protein
MAYTGSMTTESLFYPVALGFAFVLVRYLECPGYPWLAALAVALGIAFATRSQSLAFVPAIATAPLLLAVLRSRPAVLRPFVPLYVLGGAAALGLVALQAARGRSLADLLGAYSIVGEGGYDVGRAFRYWLVRRSTLCRIVPFAAACRVGRICPTIQGASGDGIARRLLTLAVGVSRRASRLTASRMLPLLPRAASRCLRRGELGGLAAPAAALPRRSRSPSCSCSIRAFHRRPAKPTRWLIRSDDQRTPGRRPVLGHRRDRQHRAVALGCQPARTPSPSVILLVLFAISARSGRVLRLPRGGLERCARGTRGFRGTGSTVPYRPGRRSPSSGPAAPIASP